MHFVLTGEGHPLPDSALLGVSHPCCDASHQFTFYSSHHTLIPGCGSIVDSTLGCHYLLGLNTMRVVVTQQ